jgi:hypothetical protein
LTTSHLSHERGRRLARTAVFVAALLAAIGPHWPAAARPSTVDRAAVTMLRSHESGARNVPEYLFTAPYASNLLDVSPSGERILYRAVCRRQGRPPCGGDADPRIYVYERTTGTRTLVSVTADGRGRPVGGAAGSALFLGNKRVVFDATGPGLVDGIDRSQQEVYVKNLASGSVKLVSSAMHGGPAHGPGLDLKSVDAVTGTVAFGGYADNLSSDVRGSDSYHLYVKTLSTGRLDRVDYGGLGRNISGNTADDVCNDALLAPGGRKIALTCFRARKTGNDTNGATDCFIRDLRTGVVSLASVDGRGRQFRLNTRCESVAAGGKRVIMLHDSRSADPYGHVRTYGKDLQSGRLSLVFNGEADVDASWTQRLNMYKVGQNAQFSITTMGRSNSRWVTRNRAGKYANHGVSLARGGTSFSNPARMLVFSTVSTNLAHRLQPLTTDFYIVRF